MKARIVKDPELGEVQPETLTIYGQIVGQAWTEVTFTDAQAAKVRGNRFFELKGDKANALADPALPEPAEPEAPADA